MGQRTMLRRRPVVRPVIGTTMLASLLGGYVVAMMAPCLYRYEPAYLSTGFVTAAESAGDMV